MHLILQAWEMDGYVREHRFHDKRRWRFDFAWTEAFVALEIEGIVFGEGGRHQRGLGFANDCEKYLWAQKLGWLVVRVPSTWLGKGHGEQMELLRDVLKQELGLVELA